MLASLIYVSFFYVFSLFATIVSLPYLFLLFPNLKDRGYAFARLFYILLLTFAVWYLSSQFHLPYTASFIFFILLLTLLFSLIAYKKSRKNLIAFLIKSWKLLLFEEVVFTLAFVFFLIVRLGNPDLWHPVMGGEKPMDVAFTNAIVRADSLPPYDPWFSGSTINYYYFGQFIVATLIKLLGIPTSFFYNIILPYFFAQTAVGVFAICHALTQSKKIGILGTFLLIGIGNFAQIPVIIHSFISPPPINGWYWTATRVMPNYEINEFPFFTFLYADLHSHLIALPIGLFFFYVCFELIKSKTFLRTILTVTCLGILLGILRMTNIWDFPTFACLAFIVCFYKSFFSQAQRGFIRKTLNTVLVSFSIYLVSFIASDPFIISYKTGSLGLSLFHGPFTRVSDYLIINGLFLFVITSYCFYRLKSFSIKNIPRKKRLLLLLPLVIGLISLFLNNYFALFITIYLFILTLVFISTKNEGDEQFMLMLSIFTFLLTSIPDVIDIKLGLGRMNTVFKFYFQAWIFFAIASSYFFYRFVKGEIDKKIKIAWLILFSFLFVGCFLYVPTATVAKIVDRMSKTNKITLDGEEYMKTSIYLDMNRVLQLNEDYNAILWLNKFVRKSEVLLEANTPIYRWGSRVSVYTGLPTVLGWDWHETAHRQYLPPEVIQSRENDIKLLYESTNPETTYSLLEKYQIRFIYLGQLEKTYYNTQGLEDLIKSDPERFKKVYSQSQTMIYKYTN